MAVDPVSIGAGIGAGVAVTAAAAETIRRWHKSSNGTHPERKRLAECDREFATIYERMAKTQEIVIRMGEHQFKPEDRDKLTEVVAIVQRLERNGGNKP